MTTVTSAASAASERKEIFFPDGNTYLGESKNGLVPDGRGTMEYHNDAIKIRYDGEFKAGKREGVGAMTYQCGDSYSGEWKNDLREGRGTYSYKDGRKHLGAFKAEKAEGHGTVFRANGSIESFGIFSEGTLTKGTMEYHNDNVKVKYDGEFKAGKREGQGSMIYRSGDSYTGGWKDDMRDGRGTYSWKDGRKHIGFFKSGKAEGHGTRLRADGSVESFGQFSSGNFKEKVYDKDEALRRAVERGEMLDVKAFLGDNAAVNTPGWAGESNIFLAPPGFAVVVAVGSFLF